MWTIIMVYFDRHIFEVLQQFQIFQIVFYSWELNLA